MFVIEFLFCTTTALRHGGTFFKTSFLINFRCSIMTTYTPTYATTHTIAHTATHTITHLFNHRDKSTYYFPYQPSHTVSSLHLSVHRFHLLCLP